MAAFFRCKFQWYALYRLKYKEPLNHNLFFGLRFDDTLNYNYGEKITSDKDLPKGDLQDYFRTQWDAQKDQVAAWEDQTPDNLKEIGTNGLSVFYDEVVGEVHPAQVQPKLRMTFEDENVILSGRPDVLEVSNQIIDNKTAKASKPETYIKQAIQPPIYSILTNPLGSTKPQEVRFDVLVKTKKPKVQPLKTVVTQEQRDATLKVVASTVDVIRMMEEKKNFPPDAFFRQGWECGYCAVAKLCRKTWGLNIPESKLHKNIAAKPPEPKKPATPGEKPKADKMEPPEDHRSIMV